MKDLFQSQQDAYIENNWDLADAYYAERERLYEALQNGTDEFAAPN